MKPTTIAFLLLAIYTAFIAMCGCAPHKLVAPSTQKVATHVGTAQQHNAQAQRYNDVNMTTAQRIDAKAAVILKYSK